MTARSGDEGATRGEVERWIELARCASASDEADQLDSLLELALAEERRGTRRIWVAPQLSRAPRDSVRVALGVLAKTSELRVVAAGIEPPALSSADWLRLAEDAATADAISEGRIELAFRSLPAHAEQFVAALRAAWSGDAIAPGSPAEAFEFELHPLPARRAGPPLFVACASREDAARAREAGIGVVVRDADAARDEAGDALVSVELLR